MHETRHGYSENDGMYALTATLYRKDKSYIIQQNDTKSKSYFNGHYCLYCLVLSSFQKLSSFTIL